MNNLYKQNTRRGSFYLFSLVLLFISLNPRAGGLTPPLQETGWSTPKTIPGYHPETWPPVLIADQNRTVHAFSTQWIRKKDGESVRAIVYNQWSLKQGWTAPVDIILSPIKEARITDVHLDNAGIFHVVFFGGDNTSANIYYSKAFASIAGESRAWSAPMIIGENAGDPEGANFGQNDQGTLYVVYSGAEFGDGLYVVNSEDDGETWSDPTPIFFTLSGEPNISELQVIKSRSGGFHAIWAVNNTSGQGRGIYYVGSKDGNEWSKPILLADAQEGLGTQTPTIFEYRDTLFAIYVTPLSGGNKTVMRRSHDEGETWDDPAMIFPRHHGVNGLISAVVDGNSDFHLFFGQRISGNPDIHGMWHSTYHNDRWVEPEGIIKGVKVLNREGYDSFDPNSARAVVSQGNVILVTWRTDPGSKGNGVWFSHKKINSPELPIVKLATPITVENHTELPITTSVPTLVEDIPAVIPSTAKPPFEDLPLDKPSSFRSIGIVLGGIAITIFLFLIAFLLLVRKR